MLAGAAVLGVLVGVYGGSLGGGPASPAAPTVTASASRPVAVPSPTGVFGRPLGMPEVAATGSGLYVAWQVGRPGGVVRSELARVDAASGRVEAERSLGAGFEQAVVAAGALWVMTTSLPTLEDQVLLRLNPDTLEPTGRWQVVTGGWPHWAAQVLAVAGGGLWVAAGNRLLRLSLPGGTITASIDLAGAASSDLSANAAGTVLVVGESDDGGIGAVQRRDPVTGELLASLPVMGVAAPLVAGPVGFAVWISEATGMMGYVQRLDARTMTAARSTCREGGTSSVCVEGTNDVTARLADGLLWVTQVAGGPIRNYCADPVTGREIAPISLPQPSQDVVLAITPDRVFYAAPGTGTDQYLRQEGIPGACRIG